MRVFIYSSSLASLVGVFGEPHVKLYREVITGSTESFFFFSSYIAIIRLSFGLYAISTEGLLP